MRDAHPDTDLAAAPVDEAVDLFEADALRFTFELGIEHNRQPLHNSRDWHYLWWPDVAGALGERREHARARAAVLDGDRDAVQPKLKGNVADGRAILFAWASSTLS